MEQIGQPYLVILAGGRGERFWPLSRKNYPKQLLKLFSEKSLLQVSFERVAGLTVPEKVFVVVNRDYEAEARAQLPELLSENMIVEPESRNTTPAMGLVTAIIRKRASGSDPVIAFMPSDLVVNYPAVWRRFILTGTRYCQETGRVIIPGSKPTRPETGFGYIRLGEELGNIDSFSAYRVDSFTEKPNQALAVKYFSDSSYRWNGGISIWRSSRLWDELDKNIPEMIDGLQKIESFLGDPDETSIINQVYQSIPSVSIDNGVLQFIRDMIVFAADYGWEDLGSWSALHRLSTQDSFGNVCYGNHILLDTCNTVIYSPNKLVSVLGVDDLAIVETDDVLLVCAKERVQDVKEILKRLRENNQSELM